MLRFIGIALLLTWCMAATTFGQERQFKLAGIGFYNFENLFDTLDTPDIRDEEFTPTGSRLWTAKRYREKLDNMATVVAQLGVDKTPDGLAILGLAEVENRAVIEDFVAHPLIANRNYQIAHHDSPDRRGIDVALIYQPKYFEVLSSRALPVMLYEPDSSRRFTRDVLYVSGLFDGEPLHVLVNHWPSRSGGEARTVSARAMGALVCKRVTDSLTAENPKAKIIIMGDLNDDPNSASLKKVLQAKGKKEDVRVGGLFNPMHDFYMRGIGSNAWRDAWSLFDQIIVSHGLLDREQDGYFYYKATIYNKKFLTQKSGHFKGYPNRTYAGGKYAGGYSDHFPVFVYLIKEVK